MYLFLLSFVLFLKAEIGQNNTRVVVIRVNTVWVVTWGELLGTLTMAFFTKKEISSYIVSLLPLPTLTLGSFGANEFVYAAGVA